MWYSGGGDEGYTSLYGGERTAKDTPRIEALGDLDEAMSAIGVARATAGRVASKMLLLRVQRELYLLMAEVASPEPERLAARLDASAVSGLETVIADLEPVVGTLHSFVAPGDTAGGAALDLARAVVRRAERRVVALVHHGELRNDPLVRYLNRLSSLLFLLARADDRESGVSSTPLA